MRIKFGFALFSLFTSSMAVAATCDVTASETVGNYPRDLGHFAIQGYESDYSEGFILVESYDRGSEKTAMYQARVSKKGEKPYEVDLWLLAKGRGVDSKVKLKFASLPFTATVGVSKNDRLFPVVSESAGEVTLNCK